MNPTLKKLSNPNLSGKDLAGLLQKHIGDGTNKIHCHEALEAISRIKNKSIRDTAKTTSIIFYSNDGDFCMTLLSVIAILKNIKQ